MKDRSTSKEHWKFIEGPINHAQNPGSLLGLLAEGWLPGEVPFRGLVGHKSSLILCVLWQSGSSVTKSSVTGWWWLSVILVESQVLTNL